MLTKTMGDVYGTFYDFSAKIAKKVCHTFNLAIHSAPSACSCWHLFVYDCAVFSKLIEVICGAD